MISDYLYSGIAQAFRFSLLTHTFIHSFLSREILSATKALECISGAILAPKFPPKTDKNGPSPEMSKNSGRLVKNHGAKVKNWAKTRKNECEGPLFSDKHEACI